MSASGGADPRGLEAPSTEATGDQSAHLGSGDSSGGSNGPGGPGGSPGPHAHALVIAEHVSMSFDVSAPWLNRLIERRPRQSIQAVDDVSFDIRRGETLALVGESGCGKSTMARLLVGLYRPTQGRVLFDGNEVTSAGQTPHIQMIFQDPYASLNPRWRVLDIVAEPMRRQRDPRTRIPDRVAALLDQVGLKPSDGQKYPHQFSGGQRQRISIARALASEPAFLVCDEPTSALDVSVQAQVLNLMRDLQRAQALTYLFISHNLAVVHHVSDRVGVMYLGRLVELAEKTALFSNPRHPYTRMLMDAIPDLKMARGARAPVAGEVPNPLSPPTGCAFHPRCPLANARCTQQRPTLRKTSAHGEVACHAVEEGRG